ncbi:MAG: DUF3501 family protein [Panacagrimonas sp.]
MKPLEISDLWKLEDYADQRPAFKQRVIEHKRPRKVCIGAHFTLLFEDRLTIQYQIQEMLRIERIFERAAIQEELDAYNPLIPDGKNWKATLLIEYEDPAVRQRQLQRLRGVEDAVWAQVGDFPPQIAVADEDLDRSDAGKTSAVHFMRFELAAHAISALRDGAELRFGVSHAQFSDQVLVEAATREALLKDLSG